MRDRLLAGQGLTYRVLHMQPRTNVPRQPCLLVVRTERYAVLVRLQEGHARVIDRIPINGTVGQELFPRIVRCYLTPGQFGTCFLAGDLPDLGDLGLPVVQIPARALYDAFQLLQQPILV